MATRDTRLRWDPQVTGIGTHRAEGLLGLAILGLAINDTLENAAIRADRVLGS